MKSFTRVLLSNLFILINLALNKGKSKSIHLLLFSFFVLSFSSLFSITPGKWNYKDKLLLFPNNETDKPRKETVYDPTGKVLLTSELVYKKNLLTEERYISGSSSEGVTLYEYDNKDRLTKEITKDSRGNISESKDYIYKGKDISKIRIYTEGRTLYMDSTIYKWVDDMISSGEITWLETKDKEKLAITVGDNKRTMLIMDEKKKPIASVEYIYRDKKQLVERRFVQGDVARKNLFVYDNQGRLKEFSFHVKQDGKWVLEKTHKLDY